MTIKDRQEEKRICEDIIRALDKPRRLVDADELMWHKSSLVEPRNKTISTGKPISDDEVCAYRLGWNDAIDAIVENAPPVDAVPVVRCKDCKYADEYAMCGQVAWYNKEDDFCSRGERREDA